MSSIRVVIADDHPLVRSGMLEMLKRMPDVEVVGEALNGCEAVDTVLREHPDVVLLDVQMPGMSGLEAAARISSAAPQVRIIMLSGHDSHIYVAKALQAGAAGYVLKETPTDDLETAIRAVAAGRNYFSPGIPRTFFHPDAERPSNALQDSPKLTARQLDVLRLIAQGQTTQAIAARLRISPKTVETHRAALMDRLQIYDIPGLVRYAIRARLVSADS